MKALQPLVTLRSIEKDFGLKIVDLAQQIGKQEVSVPKATYEHQIAQELAAREVQRLIISVAERSGITGNDLYKFKKELKAVL